jgi:GlcNAc-P-P-Und epimerase
MCATKRNDSGMDGAANCMSESRNYERILVTGGSGFIGTNLVEALLADGVVTLSVDIQPPMHPGHASNYRRCDILDRGLLLRTAAEFQPEAVIHLAARTDLVEDGGLEAYAVNVEGVRNLLEAIRETPSIQRVLFASTKLVNKNGAITEQTTDYTPDTLYGRSKAMGETMVRENPPGCAWAVVRPTSIWGPWFGPPYFKFFRAVARRTYFHMSGCDLPKRFGYVGNAVAQILSILRSPAASVNGGTFYLADYYTTTIRRWADEISRQLRGRTNPAAPDWLISTAARAGDLAKLLGMAEPPLSSFRLRNLRTPTADTPLDSMTAVLPALPFTEPDGVHDTLRWMGYSTTSAAK